MPQNKTAFPSQYSLSFLLILTNTETAVATPWGRMRNLWRASAQWKLVATHVFWWITPPTYVYLLLKVFYMYPLHFSAAETHFSSLFSSFSFLSIASLSVPILGRAPIGWHKTELSSYWSSLNWDSQRGAQFLGFAKWYQQMALTAAVWKVISPRFYLHCKCLKLFCVI